MTRVEHLSEDVVLMLGDCRELAGGVGNVDAVITDPPYAISVAGSSLVGRQGKGTRRLDFFAGDSDWAACIGMVLEAADAAISLGPHSMYWWCGHRQFGPLVETFEAAGYSTRFVVWQKACPVPAPPGSGFAAGAELCVYAYKAGRTFNDLRLSNVFFSDSFRHGQPGKVDHPTQKPIRVIEPSIRASTDEGDTVLDCFMGSGSVGVACVQLGRKFIGIELEPRYFEIAVKRISDELRRPRLQLEPVAKPVQEALSL